MALDLDGDISEAWSSQTLFVGRGSWGRRPGVLHSDHRDAWLPLGHR